VLENIKVEKSKSSGSRTLTKTKTSTIIDSDVKGTRVNKLKKSTILGLEVIETKLDQTQKLVSHSRGTHLQIIELFQTKLDTRDFSDTNSISEVDIDELESDIFEPEPYIPTTMHILDPPHSPHVKLIITDNLPPGLISIEEIVSDEEEEPLVSTSEPTYISDLLFRSLHPDPWYFTPLNFLG